MKNLIIGIIAFTLVMSSTFTTRANTKIIIPGSLPARTVYPKFVDSLDKYRNDPDFQIMAKIQYQVVNSFVTNKTVNLDNFDFTNESAFLQAIRMTKEQYLGQVKLNREAAQRFITKFNITGNCQPCTLSYAEQINAFRSVLQSFRANPLRYSNFTGSLQPGGGGTNLYESCCGFWFYICVATCALSIEAFPVYLACCTLCFNTQCCH